MFNSWTDPRHHCTALFKLAAATVGCDTELQLFFNTYLSLSSLYRNITITGGQGRDTVLDQQFKRARLQLCGDCTWTFRNITVANDSRGSGLGNDLFVAAELGARVILQDASVLRLACPSPADTLGVLDITPRSAAFRDVEAQEHQPQQHHTLDVTVQVRSNVGKHQRGSCRVRGTDVAGLWDVCCEPSFWLLLWLEFKSATIQHCSSECPVD